jgi:hypothetical protein
MPLDDEFLVNKILCPCLGEIFLYADIRHKDEPKKVIQWFVKCFCCGRTGMIWKDELHYQFDQT